MVRLWTYLLLVGLLLVGYSDGLTVFGRSKPNDLTSKSNDLNAQVVRRLVHETNWAPVSTISTNPKTAGYPFVNVISIDDSDEYGKSTGEIHFLLADIDSTGKDWRALNKVSFLFTDEQNLKCKERNIDPMAHFCARATITGKIVEMDKNLDSYGRTLSNFARRHPGADKWVEHHSFYMCKLDIEHITVMYDYTGPQEIEPEDFYKAEL